MGTQEMRAAALALLDQLGPDQRAAIAAPFDTPDHRRWTYLPGDRPGVMLGDLSPAHRRLVVQLIEQVCSERGALDTREVLWTEAIRDGLPQTLPPETKGPIAAQAAAQNELDEQRYWVRILGDPAGEVWGWRINGHHLALHLTVVGETVAAAPQFFGAQPAMFRDGPYAGRRTLAAEEDLARELLGTLEPAHRAVAVLSQVAPRDIQTRDDPVADPSRIQPGIRHADLAEPQRDLLTRLIRQYLDRVTSEAAYRSWQDLTEAGIEHVTFSWAGGDRPGQGHYYAVAGPTFLIEYDNTQQNANHIHSVWRDLRNDWGTDLLATHYRTTRHE